MLNHQNYSFKKINLPLYINNCISNILNYIVIYCPVNNQYKGLIIIKIKIKYKEMFTKEILE